MPSPIEVRAGALRPQWFWGAERMGAPGCSVGELISKYDRWLLDKIAVHAPSLIVMEAPLISDKTHIDTARKQIAMAGHTEFVCYRSKIQVFEEHNNKIKAYAGHGRATKDQMVKWAAERLGIVVKTDDEADAVWLMAHTVATICRAHRTQPVPKPAVPPRAVF